MRVWIYGAGGVGLGLGSFLLQAGACVCFVARDVTARALGERGLERSGLFGGHHAAPDTFRAVTRADDADPSPDLVLVTTKSFDSEAAARDLAGQEARLAGAPLVLCQNGWGNAEVFARHVPEERVFSARVITGFARPAPWRVVVTAHAEPVAFGSLFGARTEGLAPLCEALRRAGLPAETSPRIAELLWAKMLYNGCLNPLGAICGVPYGALGESPDTRAVVAEVAREIFAVMAAAGFRTRWSDAPAFLASLWDELLPPTAAHESSTLQDLRAGKRTEIDALNGAVVALAEAHGVAAPVNRTLVALIRFLESRSRGGASGTR